MDTIYDGLQKIHLVGGQAFGLLFFTPLIAFFCLYMLGETDQQRKARIIEEEKWRLSYYGDQTKESHNPVDK